MRIKKKERLKERRRVIKLIEDYFKPLMKQPISQAQYEKLEKRMKYEIAKVKNKES